MKFKKTKIAALTLASVLACGSLAGCALVTTDSHQDLLQTVAEVDISKGADFAAGGKYASYADAITPSSVLKRELIANYASVGATYVSYFGWSAEQTYEYLMNNLVNRQIYLQYAYVYFFENGADVEDAEGKVAHVTYSVSELNNAISAASENEKEIAGLRYFLTQDEIDAAEYTLRKNINSTLDSQEHEVIEKNHTHDDSTTTTSSSRTTPTGVDTTNADFYDPAYKIYTGMGNPDADAAFSANPAECGTYEAQDESTPASRKQAYKAFIASLRNYGLISKGENTSDITSLGYYALERKNQYETALLNKLNAAFEKRAEAEMELMQEDIEKKFSDTLEVQRETFSSSDTSKLESALDSVSDSNFVLYAPTSDDGYSYGYVINILLPFSAAQTQELSDAPADPNDTKGNKFLKRASLLETLTATDQRGAWFDADYAYLAEEADGAFGGGYLFFENNMKKSEGGNAVAQYEKISNYFGKYAYNGTVYEKEEDGETKYAYNPTKININDFLEEMESYLGFAGFTLTDKAYTENYFGQTNFYNEKGEVDYSKFLYFSASIDELKDFDANRIFVEGSKENLAMSVINELSFAYNTDTAGLNDYLGYVVSPNNTNFVKEFEYAAQLAVKNGAGSITVAPSDYGWHIMYCTMSFANNAEPFNFVWEERNVEGSFSYLYYEALKSDNFSTYSSNLETEIVNAFNNDACVTIYTERYSDRFEA